MRYLLLVCLWMLSTPVCAMEEGPDAPHPPAPESGPAGAYTLAQAFRDALARNPRVQAAEGRIAQAREGLEEVNSSRRPTVSATGNTGYAYNRNQARATSVYKGHSALGGVQISQNLYAFGRISSRLRQVEAEISEAEYAAEEIRQGVLAEVALSFSEQLFQTRIMDRLRAFEGAVAELEKSARQRIALGALDRTELYEILRRLHRARAGRIESDALYRVARARLARLTGADRKHLAPASLAGLEVATPASLEDALARSERQSPALSRARQRLVAAEGALAFREADFRPTLSLEFNANTDKVGEIATHDIEGGVNLFMHLYQGGLKHSLLRRARLAVETAQRELAAEQERIESEVQAGWARLDGLVMALREYEAAIGEIQEVVDLTENKLAVGRATYVQHIRARQSFLNAQFDVLNHRLRLEKTRIGLLRTLGVLSP